MDRVRVIKKLLKLQGINRFCSTNFSRDEMREIYFRLGNAHNHKKR